MGFLIVHLILRTATIGAVLLTGYLGGAVATHVRMGDPLFSPRVHSAAHPQWM